MPRTAVGLFKEPDHVDGVVSKIEALGLPRNEVRTLTEPATFEVTGVMSFPRLDFEVQVSRELNRIGASKSETEFYLEGLRRGGALVFATGTDDQVEAAAEVMDQHGAVGIAETSGSTPQLPGVPRPNMVPEETREVQIGRLQDRRGAAALFVW